MSNSASQFNLLKFIEHRPMLTLNKIIGIMVLFVAALLGYYIFQVNQFHDDVGVSMKLEQEIAQATSVFQPLLQQGAGNPLMGVLPATLSLNTQGFYPEFEALSHVHVDGLWLRAVEITRSPKVIKMTGAMDSPDKLEQLLKQLALQPAFKNVDFIGVNVNKGLLPGVPEKYQQEAQKLKMPEFYHFVIQTTPLTQQEKHS